MYSLFHKIKVTRLTLIYGLLFIIFAVINFSCNTHQPTSLNSETETLDLNKSTGVDYKKIEGELTKLLNHLCQTPQILSPDKIRKAADRHVTISELKLDDKFPAEFRLDDGNIFKVHIELFNGSAANELSIESVPVYFVLDPDRFPNASQYVARGDGGIFTASVAATQFNRSKGIYQGDTS